MNIINVSSATDVRFKVMHTTDRSQTAMLTLQPGQSSNPAGSTHPESDQIVLVLEGEVSAEVAEETAVLRKGDCVIVPANTPHRFTNRSGGLALMFNAYAAPAFPPDRASR
jgi:mannose-6-phosphate isomerase-like protein (cupin superfamily)